MAPPKPPPLPPWKLIRHKKETVITDEAQGMCHVALRSNLHFSGGLPVSPMEDGTCGGKPQSPAPKATELMSKLYI